MGPIPEDSMPPTIWAYSFELVPPVPQEQMRQVRALLDKAHDQAKRNTRRWQARFVLEQAVTHILVVSDDPENDGDITSELEAELTRIRAKYVRSVPLAVRDDEAPPPAELTAADGDLR
jgi:isoleucyl-tRNA synthetase